MTTTKHIHHDVIIEWAKGATIQYYDIYFHDWRDVSNNWPTFDPKIRFRVKPNPVTKWYRVALFKWSDGAYTFSVASNQESMEEFYSKHKNFIRWITERQYVEI